MEIDLYSPDVRKNEIPEACVSGIGSIPGAICMALFHEPQEPASLARHVSALFGQTVPERADCLLEEWTPREIKRELDILISEGVVALKRGLYLLTAEGRDFCLSPNGQPALSCS